MGNSKSARCGRFADPAEFTSLDGLSFTCGRCAGHELAAALACCYLSNRAMRTSRDERRNSETRAFLNAPLSGIGDALLNTELLRILESLPIVLYAPYREIPVGTPVGAGDILSANIRAISDCDFVISVLDKPGLGVAFELGIASALKKPILGLRVSDEYNGKMLEGLWSSIPPERRASSLEQLGPMVRSFLSRHFGAK